MLQRMSYANERRMQIAACLLLGAVLLVAAVLRYGVRDVFLPGWWRLW